MLDSIKTSHFATLSSKVEDKDVGVAVAVAFASSDSSVSESRNFFLLGESFIEN